MTHYNIMSLVNHWKTTETFISMSLGTVSSKFILHMIDSNGDSNSRV